MNISKIVISIRASFLQKMSKIIKLTVIIQAYINLKMPNTKSAVRRVRRVKKQTQVNRIRKSKYKNSIKHIENLISLKEFEKAKKYFPKFQSILMQVKSGVVTKKLRKKIKISKKEINLSINS